MALSVSILATITSLHLIAFVLAAKVMPDEYDERTYCVYGSDASTAYGLSAFGLLLISQTVVNGVTKCLCFGRGLVSGRSATWAVLVSFLGAEACLLAGSARNAYHTRYRGIFGGNELSCATLRKGVFAAGAALTLLSMLGSILYYWAHSKADTGGWEKHQNEGLGMTSADFKESRQQHEASEFQKV
ncbi:hypothetical protein RJ640_021910 [Escallonia rubra]|uniref:Fiber protein Fb34 n=1 Tax=Escallonia rubra TaxID=112253 RepID=A0AA88RGX4_9ASTE|nr:hypothetical protein RJ640_021910 [Escallonia rubra]